MSSVPRRNSILMALVVALAALLFLWDKPREARRQAQREQAERLFPLDPADVDTLRLRRADEVATVARAGDAWWLVSPLTERAEETTIQGLLGALSQVKAGVVVIAQSDTAVWPNFTLAPGMPGAVQVQMVASNGARTVVWVGGDNPDASGVYVRREGSRAIELADPSLATLVRLTHQGLRRYQLFDVARDSVEWLDVRSPAGRWTARRTPRGLWFTEQQPPRQLKRYEIELLLYDLSTQRIQAYVEDDVSEDRWAAYGLHEPLVDLAFTATGQSVQHRLRIGNEAEAHAWFARRDSSRDVLKISGPLVATASRPLAQLLESNPVPDNYALLDSITVRWLEGGSCTLVREGREFRLRPPADWRGDPERLVTPARNLVRGLEELTSDGTALLARDNAPESVAPEQRVTCQLFWPDRTVRFTLGWRSGEEHHWMYIDGERALHRVGRDLYFRLYSVLLAVGQIPGQQELDPDSSLPEGD